jgi:hypothetical protein
MTFNQIAQDRLDKARALDGALAALVGAVLDYRAAVDASVAAAPRAQRDRLSDTKVDAQVVGTVAELAPHLITKPGSLRPQAEVDAALLSELTQGAVR